jgi:hypothetical protein
MEGLYLEAHCGLYPRKYRNEGVIFTPDIHPAVYWHAGEAGDDAGDHV